MEELTEYGPSIEDGDPFVVAVGRLGGRAAVARRPGHVVARLPSARTGGEIAVIRSRFDGDYGSICRLRRVWDEGRQSKMTFAPISEAMCAVGDDDPAEALEALFEKWMKIGEEK